MAEHQFRVGDLVHVQVSSTTQPDAGATNIVTFNRSSGIHLVTRLLAVRWDAEPLYQVKGSGSQRERVVRESEIIFVVPFPLP